MGFEPLINQRLLPPTFPRYTVIVSRADSLDYVETLLQRLQVSTSVLTATTVQEVLVSLDIISIKQAYSFLYQRTTL